MKPVLVRTVLILMACMSFLVLYAPVLARLVQDWAHDDNYSHGFLIVPLALYFVWERRERLTATPRDPRMLGLAVVGLGLVMLLAGLLGAELFLTRVSIIAVAAGAVLFLFGWRICGVLAFPLLFLLLMIPIPAIVFNQIAFPLQLLASRTGETALSAFNIPVLREGNVIVLAHTSLEVAEACSGIRSLISLLTLGIVYGYFTDPRAGVRVLIALSTIPIAIVANGGRVAGTGVAAHYYGAQAAQGFFHTFSGWLVFAVAFVMLFIVAQVLIRIIPPRRSTGQAPSVGAQPVERAV
jgi:exosortase